MAKPKKPAKAKPAPTHAKAGAKAAGKSTKPARPSRPKEHPAGQKPASGGERPANLYALLMASDFYLPNRLPEGSYPNLAGCVRDVDHVEAFLRRRLGLTDDRLIKLTSTDTGGHEPKEPPERRPTYENMVRALQKLTATASKGDQVYVHYSGHGGRTRTLVPEVKGPHGLDEALVPVDIGNTAARYLRDVEIARLLKAMVDKGLVVTVVFDCCHSGGAARAAMRAETNLAVRGVSFVDSTPRPMESLVGTPQELAKGWGPPPGSSRGAAMTRNLVTQAEALGYTFLAACRPSESAYEAAFEGTERNGALTYWLLDALQQLGPELTYRMVYDRVLARIHSRFELQTPLLQGEADRVVFGTCALRPEFAAPVMSVAADGKSLTLLAGQANLVRPGAQFAIYPNGTLDLTQTEKRTALVRVRQVGATDATAEVVQVFGKAKVQPGDLAVLLGAPSQKLVRKVRVERADGKPPGPKDAALQAVLKALPGSGWVEAAAGPADATDFIVRPSDDGAHLLICDADAQPLPLRPEIDPGDRGAAAAVVKRLVHLTRFRAVQDLENSDAQSPLKGKLVARLLGVQDDFTPGDKRAPKPFPAGQPATLRPGQWTFLSIENRSAQVLNVAVLDLQPDWAISVAEPQETNLDFTPLDPGGQPLLIDLRASLPQGCKSGTDILKVVATLEPARFRALQLPALDQPVAAKGVKRTAGSPLDALLQTVSAERPGIRMMVPAATPGRGWATAQVEIRTTADTGSGQGRAATAALAPPSATGSGPGSPRGASAAVENPFLTFRERRLSLWQSAVEETVARRAAGPRAAARGLRPATLPLTDEAVRGSDPVRAATALAAALYAGQPLSDAQPLPEAAALGVQQEAARGVVGTAWTCNKLALQLAWAKLTGDQQAIQKLGDELALGTCDPLWAETVARYLAYFTKDQGSIPYRSGGDYVLDVKLPERATVALIGDWGTGTPTAAGLLAQVARKRPDLVLHLGDIYYSGTQAEVQARFLDLCRQAFGDTPVFSLSGNHDMYSGGAGYYWLVDQLGQKASYFCVRHQAWQLLALDTGVHDFNPFTVNSNVTYLTDEELRWHREKIQQGNDAGLKTVLLSHHQLFSAYEPIGGGAVNNLLLGQFRDVLGSVAAWFWGHEHRLDIYAPYLGLERGRCLGCSAIPEFVRADYYTAKFDVPLLPDPANQGRPVMLGDNGTVYNHAYAILSLNGRQAQVSYYQDTDEANPLFQESIS
jgi:hypothetical protein